MGLFKDAPPREHPDFTQLRFMAAGTPSWWKRNRHKALGAAGLLIGFWLAGHHDTPAPAATCTTTGSTTGTSSTAGTTNTTNTTNTTGAAGVQGAQAGH